MTKLTDLSFVKKSDDGDVEVIWHPQRTNDYATDCKAGRVYAAEAIEVIRLNPTVLGSVVRCFNQHEGVEVGFLQEIAENL